MTPSVEMNVEDVGALLITQIADYLINSVLPKKQDVQHLVYDR